MMAWVISRDLNLGMSASSNSDSSSSRAAKDQRQRGSSQGSSDSSGGAVSSGLLLGPTILPVVGSDSSTASSSENGSKGTTSGMALGTGYADAQHIINQPVNNIKELDLTSESSSLKKIFKLKFHHRHILFDQRQTLPTGYTNNIGYGGVLYSENSLDGYERNNQITNTPIEDKILTLAIDSKKEYGPYRLLTHNCQHWVNDVVAKYHTLRR